jgi:glutamate-5-semialdehyde dehydrogenase
MKIEKVRVPLGVIGIIYESRPNVTVDAAALCIKSGNATILRGGKEAINSNILLVEIMREAIEKSGFPKDIVAIIEDTSRDVANEFMRCNKYVDVLIPRGGAGLINACVMNATVPVIETGTGNCHIFIDASADKEMAINITNNGKTQRPSVCNAVESLLVHKDIAEEILPLIKEKLDEHNGLLLCAHHDALFDKCLISFDKTGHLNVSVKITNEEKAQIIDFITSLGKGYKKEQIALCEYNIGFFNVSLDKTKYEAPKKIKVFRSMSLFVGICSIILLV